MTTAIQESTSTTSATDALPPSPLAEAAVALGDLLRKLGPEHRLAARDALAHVLKGAQELGDAQREVARLTRYTERLERANSGLMQTMSAAHADREQLVRELAPALDVMCAVFGRARAQRDALAPSTRRYVPSAPAVSADAIDSYREAPVEAHHGDGE